MLRMASIQFKFAKLIVGIANKVIIHLLFLRSIHHLSWFAHLDISAGQTTKSCFFRHDKVKYGNINLSICHKKNSSLSATKIPEKYTSPARTRKRLRKKSS